jgi:hypothetical protein
MTNATTGKQIKKSYEERVREIKAMVAQGHHTRQIAHTIGLGVEQVFEIARKAKIVMPDSTMGRVHMIKPERVISESVVALEGISLGMQTINGFDPASLPADQLHEWDMSLRQSLKAIKNLHTQIRKASNDGKAQRGQESQPDQQEDVGHAQ